VPGARLGESKPECQTPQPPKAGGEASSRAAGTRGCRRARAWPAHWARRRRQAAGKGARARVSQGVANCRKPETPYSCGLSQVSQVSQHEPEKNFSAFPALTTFGKRWFSEHYSKPLPGYFLMCSGVKILVKFSMSKKRVRARNVSYLWGSRRKKRLLAFAFSSPTAPSCKVGVSPHPNWRAELSAAVLLPSLRTGWPTPLPA
jgi:hypothetical protein